MGNSSSGPLTEIPALLIKPSKPAPPSCARTLSAARAKGRRFAMAARHRAGLSDAFIAHVHAAQPQGQRQESEA